MIRALILLMVLFGAAPAGAKPKGCLTKAEVASDLIIRHGVFLREASDRCSAYEPGALPQWKQFEQSFGPRFKAERTRRENAFKREFPKTWLQVVTTFDAKMVTFDRNIPITDAFCADIQSLLDDNKKGGWGSVVKQSKVIRDESRMELKPCD